MVNIFKKKVLTESYDRENEIPVLRSSICTGEKVAGFKNKNTGAFTDVMLIRSGKDLENFRERYGISESELKKEW